MAGLKTPNRASLRNRLRSALAHKSLADTLLDTIVELQTKMNAALAKLAADGDHPAVAEVTNVTITGTGTSYDTVTGKYWTLHDGSNAAHYVWYDVTDGVNNPQVDPAPGGTGHLVNILAADTAAQIATKTRAVLDPLAQFIVPAPSGATMTVTNAVAGAATDATAGTAAPTILVTTQGSAAVTGLDTNFVATQTIPAAHILNPSAPAFGQNKTSLRRILENALAHRTLADTVLDSLVALQTNHNALMVKLDAQAGTISSTNFASTLSVTAIDPTAAASPAQEKSSVRTVLRSALANGSLADQVLDAVVACQTSLNAVLVELDAKNTLAAASLEMTVLDPTSTR